jgi:hypothetical protein
MSHSAVGIIFTCCKGHLLAEGQLLNGFLDVDTSHDELELFFESILFSFNASFVFKQAPTPNQDL